MQKKREKTRRKKLGRKFLLTKIGLEVGAPCLLDDLFADVMPLGAAPLPLHLVPRVELNVGRLHEEFLVSLLYLLLQGGRIHSRQSVAVQGDELGRNLHENKFINNFI